MSDCTHHFEHVKQTRPFTEREYMQCTKCGHQNPLGLFQHWDAERDGPAPMPDFKRNSYVYRTSIPQHMWPKLPNIIALPDNPIIVTPIVTVRKINNMWVFKCSHCPDYSVSPYWKLIYSAADYHAHNHHGR